jgi:isocitrate dehydrogenase
MNGGGLFETGAGGSAPKHVQQLAEQNHLRWDSLGEFCALGESLKYFGSVNDNPKASTLGVTVDVATQSILDNNKSPGRKVGQLDNRDSHFYFALYWARALATQTEDTKLAKHFMPIAESLSNNEEMIMRELHDGRGERADLGGYYNTEPKKTEEVMMSSATFKQILSTV